MDVSVDTNILIHLYNAYSKDLLLSSFDKVYAYEYIIDTELSGNDKDVHAQVEEDIKEGKIIKVTSGDLVDKGIKELFDEHYRDFKILFAGDRGEAYAIALASVIGIEAFVSDDTKDGGPHETLVKELIDDVVPFTYYELLFLKYLKGELDCSGFKEEFEKVASTMSHPMSFTSRIKKVLFRYHEKYSSDRDYEWLDEYCYEHGIDLGSRIKELGAFLRSCGK
jgi:hypothetical protein